MKFTISIASKGTKRIRHMARPVTSITAGKQRAERVARREKNAKCICLIGYNPRIQMRNAVVFQGLVQEDRTIEWDDFRK